MLIYICCSGGATSSFFCSKIVKEASEQNILVDHILAIIKNYKELEKQYDFILAYGPVSLIAPADIREYHLDQAIDMVLIAPQVRYMKDAVQNQLAPYNIPVSVIDMKTFGTMKGTAALADIRALIAKIQ